MPPREEDKTRRLRRDPRAEPSDRPEIREELIARRREPAPPTAIEEQPIADKAIEDEAPPSEKPIVEEPTPESKPIAREKAKDDRAVVTIADPRLEAIEPLLASGAWEEICKRLGPPDQAGKLPPTLGLIYALARREMAGEAGSTQANELAIRCMAGLFGVSAGSATALVLGKRLLRRNPAAWRSTPAPPAKISTLIIFVAIVIGAAVGWYLNRGALRFR